MKSLCKFAVFILSFLFLPGWAEIEMTLAAPQNSQTGLIIPGQCLGPVYLGTSLSEVIRALGNPSEVSSDQIGNKLVKYNQRNLLLWISITAIPEEKVYWVSTTNPAFATANGIRIGSKGADVVKAYGTGYDREQFPNGAVHVIYRSQGIWFSLTPDNVVQLIYVTHRAEEEKAAASQPQVDPDKVFGPLRSYIHPSRKLRVDLPSNWEIDDLTKKAGDTYVRANDPEGLVWLYIRVINVDEELNPTDLKESLLSLMDAAFGFDVFDFSPDDNSAPLDNAGLYATFRGYRLNPDTYGRNAENQILGVASLTQPKGFVVFVGIDALRPIFESKKDRIGEILKSVKWITAAQPPPVSEPRVRLRSAPMSLNDDDVENMLKRNGFRGKYEGQSKKFVNDFEPKTIDGDKVVIDHATGLMWHQSGSRSLLRLTYSQAERWIDELNRAGYAGYRDWRLPTAEEAASLFENKRSNQDLHIEPIFSADQTVFWASDLEAGRPDARWTANLIDGVMFSCTIDTRVDVRPVRSVK